MPRNTLTLAEAAVVTTICFGSMIAASVGAMLNGFPERPFSDPETLSTLALELAVGAGGLLYLRWRNFDLPSLVPRPDLPGVAVGIGLFVFGCVASVLLTAPFAHAYADEPIYRMVAASTLSLPVIVTFAVVNGAFEEIFLLGVLARGLRSYGLSLAVGLPLLVRLAYHLYQGPVGALSVTAFGIVLTAYYVRFGRLWPPVFAHVLADIVPFL